MNKKVIILSGVSGSGKSTLSVEMLKKWMQNQIGDFLICSVDSTSEDEVSYLRNQKINSRMHAMAIQDLAENLADECDMTVVVDNANTTEEDLAPYVATAQAYGASVELVTINVSEKNLRKVARRSKHSVSYHTVKEQFNQLQSRKIPAEWNVKITNLQCHG